MYVLFIYSEKATKFCKISTIDLYNVESTVQVLQNFVAFLEYMNFKKHDKYIDQPGCRIVNNVFVAPN